MAPNPTSVAARFVIEALIDRKGFDHWWDELDEDIQTEIEQKLAEEIARAVWKGETE